MLRPEHALRAAIVAEWLLICITVVTASELRPRLPMELQTYLDREQEIGLTSSDRAWDIFGISLVTASVVSSVGLWFFRRWARLPYLAITLCGALAVAFGGPVVQHSLTHTSEQLWMGVSGVIVALIYFAPIDGLHRKRA